MREIKFRAWDKKTKSFVNLSTCEVYFTTQNELFVGETIELGTHEEFNDFVLQQYTGLKDMNGKEIYEGDVIVIDSDKDKIIYVIVYEYGEYLAITPNKNIDVFGSGYDQLSLSMSGTEDYKIIGNIYENPELIE